MNHDPFGVIACDQYTNPPEKRIPISAKSKCAEHFTIHLPVPAEEDYQADYTGQCQCDRCRSRYTGEEEAE